MKIIKSVRIENFRSFSKIGEVLHPQDLNIIVGKNDIGKSNFLKALNLFFNGETEIGNLFRFVDDYSKYATVAKKKAKEIKIEITFNTPDRFKNKENLVWTKVWREEGLFKDTLLDENRKEPEKRNGAPQWVRKIHYNYVPAIRGNEYFNYLMGELHDVLGEIDPTAFNLASSSFIDGLKSQVDSLSNEINNTLGYTSTISVPSNFKQLFATLDFSLDKDAVSVSLNKRGDGIKAQHIPVILKFVSNLRKSTINKGVIASEAIWGFEEPENNLEMAKAFELAKVFFGFASDLQIFVNTHSPAFYTLTEESDEVVNLYLAQMDLKENKGTKLKQLKRTDENIIHEEIGILPIISTKIKEAVEFKKEADELRRKVDALAKPALIMEGKTDVKIVNTAWEKLNAGIAIPIDLIEASNSVANGGNGGAGMLKKTIETIRPDGKVCIAMFDRDHEGIKEYNSLSNDFTNKEILGYEVKNHNNGKAFAFMLPVVKDDEQTEKFGEAENLAIEFYFDEADFRKEVDGEKLQLEKDIIIKKSGTGKEIGREENDSIYYLKIRNNKTVFAEKIVLTLDVNAFRRFKIIFDIIEKILE